MVTTPQGPSFCVLQLAKLRVRCQSATCISPAKTAAPGKGKSQDVHAHRMKTSSIFVHFTKEARGNCGLDWNSYRDCSNYDLFCVQECWNLLLLFFNNAMIWFYWLNPNWVNTWTWLSCTPTTDTDICCWRTRDKYRKPKLPDAGFSKAFPSPLGKCQVGSLNYSPQDPS